MAGSQPPPAEAEHPTVQASSRTVFSGERTLTAPEPDLGPGLVPDTRLKMDGLAFLAGLPADAMPAAFLDPQYRGVLDKMAYGNEGKSRERARVALPQMTEDHIARFVAGIDRCLMPSGHLFLWIDKFHLCTGIGSWLEGTALETVDLLTWDKQRMGMGYRPAGRPSIWSSCRSPRNGPRGCGPCTTFPMSGARKCRAAATPIASRSGSRRN